MTRSRPRIAAILIWPDGGPTHNETFDPKPTALDGRGLLEETVVLCVSDHGRTPKLSSTPGGGRDHWARAYSALLAGVVVARGKVVGKTDKVSG